MLYTICIEILFLTFPYASSMTLPLTFLGFQEEDEEEARGDDEGKDEEKDKKSPLVFQTSTGEK